MGILNKRDSIACAVLFSITFFSSLYLMELYQPHWDGLKYSIAIFNYSLEDQTPASLEYPFYIGLAAILNVSISDPRYSLIFESFFFTSIGIVIVFIFGKKLGKDYLAGVIASCLYFSSPAIYFLGLTAYAYGISSVFYLYFAYKAYRYVVNRKGSQYMLGFSYALPIGFWSQNIFCSWPILIYVIFVAARAIELKILDASIIGCLVWFISQVIIVGDLEKFVGLVSLIENAKMPRLSFMNAVNSIWVMVKGAVLTLGRNTLMLIHFVIYKNFLRKTSAKFLSGTQWKFFALWITPPFLFNLLIRSDHTWYQLVYQVSLILVVRKILNDIIKNYVLLKMVVAAFISRNSFYFFANEIWVLPNTIFRCHIIS